MSSPIRRQVKVETRSYLNPARYLDDVPHVVGHFVAKDPHQILRAHAQSAHVSKHVRCCTTPTQSVNKKRTKLTALSALFPSHQHRDHIDCNGCAVAVNVLFENFR
jgi:L-ascorbate metabolism protein UlaG (beta-lactamase superfamily)